MAGLALPAAASVPRFGNILAMRAALLIAPILLAIPTAAFAPAGPYVPPSRVEEIATQPDAVSVRFDSGDTASFRLAERRVTDIDFHVQGKDYPLALKCAGGLADVHFDTAELDVNRSDVDAAERSFALFFDIGQDQDRQYGALPKITLSFRRGRVIDMTVTNRTSDTAGYTSHLCAELPVGRITCKDTRQLQGLDPETLVQQLRQLPPILPAMGPMTMDEKKRESIYEELLDWGAASIPPLVNGLRDPDVGFRRNVTLAFSVLSGGWWQFECGTAKLNISSALPALVAAFRDSDASVRAWAAEAVGNIGEGAAGAVLALIGLLNRDEGARNSACLALGRIGPAAKAAIPALRRALRDPNPHVREFAARAIQKIEG
jgi:hypothetical protein